MFAGVVCHVGLSSCLEIPELGLCSLTLELQESHVIGFGRLGGHGDDGKFMDGVFARGD